MGITGELVRSVFSKSNGHQAISNGSEKKKWSSSVRSYLCGDELSSILAAEDSASARNSTLAEADFSSFRSNVATNTTTETRELSSAYAEEDSASVRSSEATVNQPLPVASELRNRTEKRNSTYRLFQQEDAALIIQSAFKNFMGRKRLEKEAEAFYDEEKSAVATPGRESVGTSVEVQTGNSIKDERDDGCQIIRRRAQVLKIQEEWDDSTVSSVISKMRTKKRLEAATRRERALAYAFSQQPPLQPSHRHSCDALNAAPSRRIFCINISPQPSSAVDLSSCSSARTSLLHCREHQPPPVVLCCCVGAAPLQGASTAESARNHCKFHPVFFLFLFFPNLVHSAP